MEYGKSSTANYFVTFFDKFEMLYNIIKKETTHCTSKRCFVYAVRISINEIKKTLTRMELMARRNVKYKME